MAKSYTAVLKEDEGWWTGWIEEIPGVNCQERTRDELLETLRVTLKEALALNRQEALEAAGNNKPQLNLTVSLPIEPEELTPLQVWRRWHC